MDIFKVTTEVYADADIKNILAELKSKKVTIITDAMMVKVGLIAKVEDALKKSDIQYDIFDGVEMNPSLESVKRALDQVIDFSPETIIAVGGGSTLDSAKAVRYFLKRTGIDIPVIAIPTTSGTGSEVTSYAVITDTVNSVKIPIKDEEMMPKIAILDPEFTRTLPKSVVADGGIDALTHAIEAYSCSVANFHTQIYAMTAIKGIFKNLLKMYKNIEDRDARVEMAKASCIAGIAFEKSGLGINHSVAHAIGGKFHKPHGRSNGVVLPYIIRFNSENMETVQRYYEIAKELELPCSSVKEGAESLAIAVEILNRELGIPARVKDMGIDEVEYNKIISEMAETALNDICTSGNIRKVSVEDLENIFRKVF
jgi:1-propanol dehydrogenase